MVPFSSRSRSLSLKSSLFFTQTSFVVIWWLFHDDLRAREQEWEKKEPQIPRLKPFSIIGINSFYAIQLSQKSLSTLFITNSTWLSQLADEEIQNSRLVVPGKVNQKLFPYPKNTWVGEKTLITKAKRTQTPSHKLGLLSNSFICLISNLLGYFVSKLQSIANSS